jgi:hypothetical protein
MTAGTLCTYCRDLGERHDKTKTPLAECLSTTPSKADGKRRERQKFHEPFGVRLEQNLEKRRGNIGAAGEQKRCEKLVTC